MGFLRKKDAPYEVPDEVSGNRSEIDDFRARMRQQAGGDEAKENPELAKLKDQYGDRVTNHLGVGGGRARGRDGDEDGEEGDSSDFSDLLGGGGFASPSDSGPSGFVPGLDDDRPSSQKRTRKKASGGGGDSAFACDDCGTGFKESWSKCPKCGGKVEKVSVDPEVESLRAQTESGPSGMRQVNTETTQLDSLMGGVTTEFGRENDKGGLRDVDDLLTDFSDSAASQPAPGPSGGGAGDGDGFACKTCKTEYKEKWGKCPKCGGDVERALAPDEVSQLEHQHRDLENKGTTSPPANTGGGGGSGMLGDLMGGSSAPAPPPEPAPSSGGLPELDDLSPQDAPTPATSAPEPQDSLPSLGSLDSGGDDTFKPSAEPAGPPPLDDLTQDLGLPDEEDEEPVPEPGPEATPEPEEERELTREEVGIKQADMGTDFSFAKPGGERKRRRKKRQAKGQPPRKGQRRPGQRPPLGPTADARPDPFARPPKNPVDLMNRSREGLPPRPDKMESDLLEMLREPKPKKPRD